MTTIMLFDGGEVPLIFDILTSTVAELEDVTLFRSLKANEVGGGRSGCRYR